MITLYPPRRLLMLSGAVAVLLSSLLIYRVEGQETLAVGREATREADSEYWSHFLQAEYELSMTTNTPSDKVSLLLL